MSKGFQFKQFFVAHDRCAMKVGTDGVLLGAVAPFPPSAPFPHQGAREHLPLEGIRVLDIGTGTGLVALMIAQKAAPLSPQIDAIDIVPEAVEQAEENFRNSPWAEHLHAYQSSLQDWSSTRPYSLIVSNPPYFVDSLKNPDKARETARHTDTLSYEELIKHSKRLLASDGVLQLILPIEAETEIRRIAATYDLSPVRTIYIRTTPAKAPKRFIIRFSPQSSQKNPPQWEVAQGEEQEYLTLMGANGEPRSREYQELMKDFYL